MRAEVAAFTVSALINLAFLHAFDRSVSFENFQTKMLEQKASLSGRSGNIQFEFIESPPQPVERKPREGTKKISDRDSLSRDLLKDKSHAGMLPHIGTKGPADQLRQVRVVGPPPSQAVLPQEAQNGEEASKQNAADENEKLPPQENILKEKGFLSAGEASIFKAVPKSSSANPQAAGKKAMAPAKAQAPVTGLTGRDKITTHEMSKSKSHGAELYGITSFEATGSGMGVYMKNLKEKIWMNWFPYLSFRYPQDFKTADAVISFTLNAKGDVKIIRVVESEGSPLFASFCVEAVQRASNFGELPKEILALIGKDEFEIKFGFHYK